MKKILPYFCCALMAMFQVPLAAQSYVDGFTTPEQKQLFHNHQVQEVRIKLYGYNHAYLYMDTLGRMIKYVNLPGDSIHTSWNIFTYDKKDRLIGRKYHWLKKGDRASPGLYQQNLTDTLTDSWDYVFDSANRLCRTLHTDMFGKPGGESSEYLYDTNTKLWKIVKHNNWTGHYTDTLFMYIDTTRERTAYHYFRSNHTPSTARIRNYDRCGHLIAERQYSFIPDSVLTHKREYIYSAEGWLISEQSLLFGWKNSKKIKADYVRYEYDSLGNILSKENGKIRGRKSILKERFVYKYNFSSNGLPKFIWVYTLKSGKLKEESMFEFEYSFYR